MIMAILMASCSTTTSDVRQLAVGKGLESAKGVLLAIEGDSIQTSSQGDSRILSLHSSGQEILDIARNVARLYGFNVVNIAQANYVIDISSAVPDGGACIQGAESAELGLSYSLSLITFGAFPATGVHCLVVEAGLYSYLAEEKTLMAEFVSDVGQVEVFAGSNEIDNYRRVVKPGDELRGIEASIGGLLSEIIREGAFE